MSIYEKSAIDTVTAIGKMTHPLPDSVIRAEWQKSVSLYTSAPSSIRKGCPFGAFLGLYKSGFIKGIPAVAGYRPAPASNAFYAIQARNILMTSSGSYTTKKALWHRVCSSKSSNCQIDVVVGLYNAGLLI